MSDKTYMVVIKHVAKWKVRVYKVEYMNDIHQYYDELDCRTFDIINGEVYTPYLSDNPNLLLIVDDDGKLKDRYPTLPVFKQEIIKDYGYRKETKVTDELIDVLVGDIGFVLRDDYDQSEIVGLSAPQANALIQTIIWYLSYKTKITVQEDQPSPLS